MAGIFALLWDEALGKYNEVIGLDLEWTSLDGSPHKATLDRGGPNPTDRAKGGVKCYRQMEAQGIPIGWYWTGPTGMT